MKVKVYKMKKATLLLVTVILLGSAMSQTIQRLPAYEDKQELAVPDDADNAFEADSRLITVFTIVPIQPDYLAEDEIAYFKQEGKWTPVEYPFTGYFIMTPVDTPDGEDIVFNTILTTTNGTFILGDIEKFEVLHDEKDPSGDATFAVWYV